MSHHRSVIHLRAKQAGQGEHPCALVRARLMDLSTELPIVPDDEVGKETSEGGLAVSPTLC
jgi:hypothetical protein